MAEEISLSKLFGAVVKTLAANQQKLDEADTLNHDHGSNMVKNFTAIQKAVTKQKDKPVSEQLAYASQTLLKKSPSGSAQVYAAGLQKAADSLEGQQLTRANIGSLINALMGTSTQPASVGGSPSDLLGSLLGGAVPTMTQQQPEPENPASSLLGSLLGGMSPQNAASQGDPGGSDLLGSLLGGASGSASGSAAGGMLGTLLGGLAGGNAAGSTQAEDGLDIQDLMSAGMAYLSAKQSGSSSLEAIMQALSHSSTLGNRPDRQESGALVVSTILNFMNKKK